MTGAVVVMIWLVALLLWLPVVREMGRLRTMPGVTGGIREELPRRAMHGRLEVEVDWSQQSGEGLAIICFRAYGPGRAAALERLHVVRRAHETVIRWDERTVLLVAWNVDERDAILAARRIGTGMRDARGSVPVDVAIALVGRHGTTVDELLVALDERNLRALESLEPATSVPLVELAA